MKCNLCGCDGHIIKMIEKNDRIQRWYRCNNCGKIFNTVEKRKENK